MDITDIGEFGLIHRFAPKFLKNLQGNVLGIGDDCAVIPYKDESLLITTDLLLEDIHFLRNKISPRELGYKSLAVNLSDIAAMGGTPTAAFLSIGLPKDISVEWLDDFFDGFADLSQNTSTPLLGGDTTKSKDRIVINVAVLGKTQSHMIKYRSTAQVGDILCVTDVLGDSGGGLNAILNGLENTDNPDIARLLEAHHQPRAHLEEGAWLAKHDSVHAMLDVSDGIDSDVQRILEASQVGARIEVADIPVSASLSDVSEQYGWNAKEIAATGGEDYCLLCTVEPSAFQNLAHGFENTFDKPLFKIGTIEKKGGLVYHHKGHIIDFAKRGWDHFKQ